VKGKINNSDGRRALANPEIVVLNTNVRGLKSQNIRAGAESVSIDSVILNGRKVGTARFATIRGPRATGGSSGDAPSRPTRYA